LKHECTRNANRADEPFNIAEIGDQNPAARDVRHRKTVNAYPNNGSAWLTRAEADDFF